MNAIIIDDESQSHLALRELLKRHHPEVTILAEGYCVEEGYQLVQQHQPDVVFLDIEMPDGLGFDLVKRFNNPPFHIIFITAHNKYAITAIKFGALDYLLKPIDKEELAKALQKVNKHLKDNISQEQILILLETLRNYESKKLPTRIAIPTSEGILYKQVKDIIRLEAQGQYTEFILKEHVRTVLASSRIGIYADQFEPYHEIMQVHRSHIVNLYEVDKFVKADGGYLVMKNGDDVPVSKRYRDDLLGGLDNL